MIELDGSKGEAGGQMLRTALALSVLKGKAFHMSNIRKGRPTPGLKAQHLQCIQALQQLGVCDVQGATLGSTDITFIPGQFQPKNITLDVGTAGSLTLLLQALLLPCMTAKKAYTLTLIGGTDVAWSLPIDYFKEVVLPHFQRYATLDLKLLQRGYYPKGQGTITFMVKPPFQEHPLYLTEKGTLLQIKGVSHASADLQAQRIAERQQEAAQMRLKHLNVPISIDIQYTTTASPGSGITLWAIYSLTDEIQHAHPIRLGADALADKTSTPEEVGAQVAEHLLKEIASGAAVDEHAADNLIPLLALVGGSIRVSAISEHTLTNIAVVEAFVEGTFTVDKEKKLITFSR